MMTRFRRPPRMKTLMPDTGNLVTVSSVRSESFASLATILSPTIELPHAEPVRRHDVCAFLYARCQDWQRAFLDDAGLTCMFDVDAGGLPIEACETLASIARNRLLRLANAVEPPGGTITITLRHRSPMWALAITDTHLRLSGPRLTNHEMATLKSLAGRIEGAYVIQPVEDGTLIAVLFSDRPGVLTSDALAESRAQFRQ